MSTRGLTAVFVGGEYKVAQYGQWDHYPEGQGVAILTFLRKIMRSKPENGIEKFRAQLDKCRWITDTEYKSAGKDVGLKGDGWMTMEQAEALKRHDLTKFIDRDFGGAVLEMIHTAEDEVIRLRNSLEFAADSLWCEYAYVVDLDAGRLEVYKGFNTTGPRQGERFAHLVNKDKAANPSGEKYYHVTHLRSWPLSKLPTKAVFVKALTPKEEE